VYVIPHPDAIAGFGVPCDYAGLEQARQEIADDLKCDAARLAHELGVAFGFIAEHGDATRALTDVARAMHAHLVVVGRSAKLVHHLAGSLSHRLTSRNDAPVVVVVP
jgi:K+-sensing histidine kinase KdpD